MLFLAIGMIYERRHTRQISELGGLFRVMPVWTTLLIIATLGSIGLPGTNGFVGEFLILLGTLKVNVVHAVIATAGIVLAAVYMLRMLQRVVFGQITRPENEILHDIGFREQWILYPLVIMVFWIGIYPNVFLSKMEPTIEKMLNQVYSTQGAALDTPASGKEFTIEHP
jgi:NADH-quinone oxidoreductase subunit M